MVFIIEYRIYSFTSVFQMQQTGVVPPGDLGVKPHHTLQWTHAHLTAVGHLTDKLDAGAAPFGDEGSVHSL